MDIVFTIDEKFTRFCAVAIASLLKHNKTEEICFHIVTDNLTEKSKTILSELAKQSGACTYFYHVPKEKTEGYQVKAMSHRISLATFYRCMLPSLLPSQLSKAIYLDSDILVLDSIKEIWNTDLNNIAIAGIEEARSKEDKHCDRLGYAPSYRYINAGVLLINLDYWRKYNIEEKCRQYYAKNIDRMLYNAQDLLNALLYDKKAVIPTRYNVQDAFYRKFNKGNSLPPEYKSTYQDALLHPAILHYTNRKPWEYHCMHPLRKLFYDYQNLTPYAGQSVLNNPLKRIHRFIHLLPYLLGFKQKRYYSLSTLRENQ